MQNMLLKLWCDSLNRLNEVRTGERGATAVEYGIMVALIAVVIIVVVRSVGQRTSNAFSSVNAVLP